MDHMTHATGSPAATTERRGPVLVITLDRPEARNACNGAMSTAVGTALAEADADPEIRCVVLTGAGDRSFCAGADLKALAAGEDLFAEGHPEWGLVGVISHPVSVPVIAAVNGTALGGGLELVLSCDLAVAADTATFGLPEVRRGLIAGAGGAFRLAEFVPRRIAMEMLLTGEPVDAGRALEIGLVNSVVPASDLLDATLTLAETIAANAPLAVQASKRVALGIHTGDGGATRPGEDAAWRHTGDEFAHILGSEDAVEGPAAFAEKRAPVWKAR